MTKPPKPAKQKMRPPRQRAIKLVIPSLPLAGTHGSALHLPILHLSPLEPEDTDA